MKVLVPIRASKKMLFKEKIKNTNGFTLIELLVVISIIGLLSSVVLSSLNAAKSKARDTKRATELQSVQIAMELYNNDYGHFPAENAGLYANQSINANGIIGEGSGLDTLLDPYMPDIPVDPMGPGNASYNYYYDGNSTCGGGMWSNVAVVFAKNMEIKPTNGTDFCTSWGGEGGSGGANAWHIVLGQSPDI